MTVNEYKKDCQYCQGKKDIIAVKGFIIGLDDNYLLYSFWDKKKAVGNGGAKKIKYCPICGRKLTQNKLEGLNLGIDNSNEKSEIPKSKE